MESPLPTILIYFLAAGSFGRILELLRVIYNHCGFNFFLWTKEKGGASRYLLLVRNALLPTL
jgi:hypothetical protein